jgi:hypothetical protein
MKTTLIIAVFAILSCRQVPSFSEFKVDEIKVLDSSFKLIRVIKDTSEINDLKGLILIPGDLNYSDNPLKYNYKIDVLSNQKDRGRWLYDDASGSIVYLSHLKQPKYRVSDIAKFNKILLYGQTQ